MTTKDALTELELLSFYMKSYIDVIASFYKDGNKDCRYIKGSIAYQEILLAQTLGQTAGGHVLVNGYEKIFEDKVRCITDFNSWKEAMFGELNYIKNKKQEHDFPHNVVPMTDEMMKSFDKKVDEIGGIDVGRSKDE